MEPPNRFQNSWSQKVSGTIGTSAALKVGEVGTSEQRWNGWIDQVVVYAKAQGANAIMGLFQSRLPSVTSVFMRPNLNGLPEETKLIYHGTYLRTQAVYEDTNGDLVGDGSLSATSDWSRASSGTTNWTNVHHSTFYGRPWPTKTVRPDERTVLRSYNSTSGLPLATLSIDRKRTRTTYDLSGRPTASCFYNSSSSVSLLYDMETPTPSTPMGRRT
jgi:hypothetical protein